MSEFSTMLNDIIKNNNISVYSMAKTIDCNRSWFQKVMIGERKMNFTSFCAMYKELVNKVDSEVLSNLYEKFVEDFYGEKEYKRVLYIKDRLYETKRLQDYLEGAGSNFDIEEYAEIFKMSDSEKRLMSKIDEMIKEELAYATYMKILPKLYVNIPTDWSNIKNLFLIVIHMLKLRGNIDFKYSINSKCNDDTVTVQVENFITSCEFSSYGINTLVTSEFTNNTGDDNAIFPYYIVTGRKVMMISDDGNLYIEYDEKEKVKLICEKIESKMSGMKNFLIVVNPDTYLSKLLSGIMNNVEEIFDVGNRICVAMLYTRDILKKIVPDNYPKRDFVIETLDMVYGKWRKGNLMMYFTIESVRHFMESNESKQEGQYFNLQFTDEIKLDLLKKLYHYYEERVPEIHMLKTGKYLANDDIHIFGWDDIFVGATGYVYYGDIPVEATNFTHSPTISGYMRMYNDYMKNSNICLDKENSLKVLKNLIASYEK